MASCAVFAPHALRPAISAGRQASGMVPSMIADSPCPHPMRACSPWNAHHQAQMLDVELVSDGAVLRADHVNVSIAGEVGVETVAGLARFSVADAVRDDDEVLVESRKLAGIEEHGGESVR